MRVTAEKAKNPARLDQFRIEVEAPVPLTFEHRKGVEQAIKRCIVHNTLMHPPKVVTTVLEPAAATRRSAPAA